MPIVKITFELDTDMDLNDDDIETAAEKVVEDKDKDVDDFTDDEWHDIIRTMLQNDAEAVLGQIEPTSAFIGVVKETPDAPSK